ncbi:uncharacterized protein LOC143226292 isoform X2 [Tachypleus tridentatus]|uniref:uncharacterized protein LOC143226292 isoform X2 n=1 Tax=Tachypleus tridentatus TaxID=6853 RepID=UPI003FD453CB
MFIKLKDITIFVLLFPLANTYITYQVSECIGGQKTISLSSSSNYNSAGILTVSKEGFLPLSNCNITLIAPIDHRIVISFQEINLRKQYGECLDYLKIWTSKNSSVTKCGNYKYWKEELSFQSSENTLLMTFHLGGNFLFGEIDFTLTFTACFYRGHRSTCGNSNNFQCDNLCCIYDGLTCDGHNNCGDSSDESRFGNSDCRVRVSPECCHIVLLYRQCHQNTVTFYHCMDSVTTILPHCTTVCIVSPEYCYILLQYGQCHHSTATLYAKERSRY